MSSSRKKKTPPPSKAIGVNSEQLSFLPKPELSPTMPTAYTAAWLALRDMVNSPITQIDWLALNRGWRLSAAVKTLDYDGWPVTAEWVTGPWPRPIKRYSLPEAAHKLAAERLRIGGADAV